MVALLFILLAIAPSNETIGNDIPSSTLSPAPLETLPHQTMQTLAPEVEPHGVPSKISDAPHLQTTIPLQLSSVNAGSQTGPTAITTTAPTQDPASHGDEPTRTKPLTTLFYIGPHLVLDASTLVNFPRRLSDFKASFARQSPRHVIFCMYRSEHDYVERSHFRMMASLRAANSTALVVIFCRAKHVPLVMDEFSDFGNVHVIGFEDHEKHKIDGWWASSFRYTLAKVFLDHHAGLFEAAMTSDFLDVIFQLDPFEWAVAELRRTGKEIIVAEEPAIMGAPKQPDNGINLQWALSCGGQGAKITGNHVLCSGTTIGKTKAMQEYLDEMDRKGRDGNCGRLALDQGVHNAIMYSRKEFSSVMLPQNHRTGRILTMNGVQTVWFDEKARLTNALGQPYVLTHQINRCWWVRKFARMVSANETSPSGSDVIGTSLRTPLDRKVVEETLNETNWNCSVVEWPPYFQVPQPKKAARPTEVPV